MATKKKKPRPGSIAARKEEIRAPKKKRNRFNPLQAELDKPLSKSFKEGLSLAATVIGPGKAVKGVKTIAKGLTKAEKAFRTKLKRGIRQNIEEAEQFGRKKGKIASGERKALREDIRNLGKIIGEKDAAKFAQAKKAAMFKKPKISKAKPRARK